MTISAAGGTSTRSPELEEAVQRTACIEDNLQAFFCDDGVTNNNQSGRGGEQGRGNRGGNNWW